ncbi:MAG: hypothetical protein MHPSP_004905, partial [Paramarteilia canceri]
MGLALKTPSSLNDILSLSFLDQSSRGGNCTESPQDYNCFTQIGPTIACQLLFSIKISSPTDFNSSLVQIDSSNDKHLIINKIFPTSLN